jgi:uncharacterized protein
LAGTVAVKKLALDPYHLFRFQEHNYLLDIGSSAVMRLDAPAYEALSLRRAGTPRQAIANRLANSHGVEAATSVEKELRWLERQGLLMGPVAAYDEHEDEAYIQRLTGMATNKIELYLAEDCNLRCRYCYVNENQALNNGLMRWEVARQAIDFAFSRAGQADTVSIWRRAIAQQACLSPGDPVQPGVRPVPRQASDLFHDDERDLAG